MGRTGLADCSSRTSTPSERGRPTFAVETLLRIHFLQQLFNLSDPAIEEELYDMTLFREFAGLEMGEETHGANEHPLRVISRKAIRSFVRTWCIQASLLERASVSKGIYRETSFWTLASWLKRSHIAVRDLHLHGAVVKTT